MDNASALCLLMDMRVNGILDRILERDEEYQEIARKSGKYLDRLETMELPQEARSLIDLHSCEQNAKQARSIVSNAAGLFFCPLIFSYTLLP